MRGPAGRVSAGFCGARGRGFFRVCAACADPINRSVIKSVIDAFMTFIKLPVSAGVVVSSLSSRYPVGWLAVVLCSSDEPFFE